MLFTSWRFLHSINTESLHRRAGKPRLSRHSEWEILQNGSRALFYISPCSSQSLSSRFPLYPAFYLPAERNARAFGRCGNGARASISTFRRRRWRWRWRRHRRRRRRRRRRRHDEKRPSVARPCNYRSGNPRFRSSSVLLRRRRRHHHHHHHHHYHHHYHLPPVTAAAAAVAATVTTTSAISRETIFVYTRVYYYLAVSFSV